MNDDDIKKSLIKCFNNVGIILNESEDNLYLEEFLESSFAFITLIVEIEEMFEIEIPDEFLALEVTETFEDLANIVKQLLKGENKL